MTARPVLRRAATYADLESVPDRHVGEILAGELVVSPRPAMLHASVEGLLMGELSGPFQRGRGGPGGWIIVIEPELHLHGDALVPDLAGWRRERMPTLLRVAAVELAPDWVCEILSPSTEARDRGAKMPIYARVGVAHVWLIDPELETLEIFALENGRWMVVGTFVGNRTVRAVPFDAIELDLAALWQR